MAALVCSPCGERFTNVGEFYAHSCSAAGGANPTQPEYLKNTTTPNFDAIAKAALERGAK